MPKLMLDTYLARGTRPKAIARLKPQLTAGTPLEAPLPASGQPKKRTSDRLCPVVGHIGVVDPFGFRLGTMKSLAVHMYARRGGATLSEVRAITGHSQFGVLRELETKGYKIDEYRFKGDKGHWVTRYFVRPPDKR